MKSMTGFAYSEKRADDYFAAVEIKSYNNRFLEVFVNLSGQLSPLEPRIRALIGECCKRGKIEVTVHEKKKSSLFSAHINTDALRAYISAIEQVKSLLPPGICAGQDIPLKTFIQLDGVIEAETKTEDENESWSNIKGVFLDALRKFEGDREREGRHTEENILSYIAVLEESRDVIAALVPQIEASIKDNMRLRFAELVNDKIDENRLLAETAILLMKYTIAEEISRLSAHLAEFRAEIARDTRPGKKLDFISQEINREVNTIGAKTPLIEVSRVVIGMKDAVENIREQLRNVE
ncbi:MAG: YicC family protein [Spirochaetaceae bacterium]|jgi:uncharacterized protein (TIGR00255 family)|nr:YicC family protein [Spirochaetaceae bacterium]